MPDRRFWVIGSIVVGVVAALGAIAVYVLRELSHPTDPTLPDTVVVRSINDPGEREHATAVAALVEGLPQRLAAGDTSGLSTQARAEFGDVTTALPPGATLTVDIDSWRRTGSVASVLVVLTSPAEPAESYLVAVVFEDGQWRVSSTIALTERSSPT